MSQGPFALTDLKLCQCHWPLNDAVPYQFCGAAVREGSRYCAEHHSASVKGQGASLTWVTRLLRKGRS